MARTRGRPLDDVLTASLHACTVDLLAEEGLSRVTADAVAAAAHAGKAAIYRRWSSVTDLIAGAVRSCELVSPPACTGSLRSDLDALLRPLTRPLDRCERAAASLLGQPDPQGIFDRFLDDCVVQPLAAAVADIVDRHSGDIGPITPARLRLLGLVIQSLWWQRYISSPATISPEDLTTLVDHVLVPLLERDDPTRSGP